jgi:hypothetical protein
LRLVVSFDVRVILMVSVPYKYEVPQSSYMFFKVCMFGVFAVPFVIWFETPLRMTLDASVQGAASASAGLATNYSIGDYTIGWDPKSHWYSRVAKSLGCEKLQTTIKRRIHRLTNYLSVCIIGSRTPLRPR